VHDHDDPVVVPDPVEELLPEGAVEQLHPPGPEPQHPLLATVLPPGPGTDVVLVEEVVPHHREGRLDVPGGEGVESVADACEVRVFHTGRP
jgi:hypothetical protein